MNDVLKCKENCKIYLHQLMPVLPRNSEVSVFQMNSLNPSHPGFSTGLIANWYWTPPAGAFMSFPSLPSAFPLPILNLQKCKLLVSGNHDFVSKKNIWSMGAKKVHNENWKTDIETTNCIILITVLTEHICIYVHFFTYLVRSTSEGSDGDGRIGTIRCHTSKIMIANF